MGSFVCGLNDTTVELFNILEECIFELQEWNTDMRDFLAKETDTKGIDVTY